MATPAKANITFNATFGSSITNDANAAQIIATINQAINFYEANITNPITVKITFNEMNSGLGESSTFFGSVSYTQYLAALMTHSSGDAVDTSALASLQPGPNNPVDGDPKRGCDNRQFEGARVCRGGGNGFYDRCEHVDHELCRRGV